MDTKEMNIAIYRAIAAKANELFQRVKISAGTYSAKELSENKKDKALRVTKETLEGEIAKVIKKVGG